MQNLPFDPTKTPPPSIQNLPYIPEESPQPSFNLLTRVDPVKAASEFRHVATFKPGKFERDADGNADIQGVKVDAVNADLLEQALKTRDRVELEEFEKKLHRFNNILTGPQKDFLRSVAENRFEAITDEGFEAMTTEGLKTLGEAETNEVTGNEVGQADETGALKSGSISIDGKQTDLGGLSKKLGTWDNIVDGGITDEAGASYVDEVPEDVQREVGEALLGILPGTGEAIEAKEAYQAFQAAREALRQGDLSDAGINAALAGVSAAGTVPVLGKAPAYAKKVVRLLARGIDASTDGTSLGKAAGAAAIGATGALVQDTPRNDEKNVGAERAMLDRPFPPPPGFEPPDTPLPDRTESLPTEKLNELKDTYPALEEIDTILEGFPDQRDEFTQILILMASSRGTPKTQRRTNFTLNRSLNKLKEMGIPRSHSGGGESEEFGYQKEHHFKEKEGLRARRSDGRIEVRPTLEDIFFEEIQTVDTLADGETMTKREDNALQDIRLHKEIENERGGVSTYPKLPDLPDEEWEAIMGPRIDAYIEATFGHFRKK